MQRQGWTLLFHPNLIEQLTRLERAASRAEAADPSGAASNANVKLYRAVAKAIMEIVPADPGSDIYRQGNTLGKANRHWRRIKIGRRFRLFFRYDTRSRIIVFAWLNDRNTLRQAGKKSDVYTTFARLLASGSPPGNWSELVDQSRSGWSDR